MNKTNLLTATATFLRAIADALDENLTPAETPAVLKPEEEGQPVAPPVKRTRGPNKPKETVNLEAADAAVDRAAERVVEKAEPTTVNEQAEPLTAETLRELFAPIVKRGDGIKVKEICAKYGCKIVAELDPKDYAAFKADIEVLLV